MKRILSFIFALLMVLPLSLAAGASPASTVSSPLEDLRACENFSEDDYPVNESDTSLSVIHLAESANGGVLLYVYCPSQKLIASSVNLSLTETTPDGDVLDFQLYNLKVRSQEGVFQKYIVEGLTVPDKIVRHYEVASILRPWDENIDAAPTDDNTIHEVPYEVGYMWSYLSGDDGSYIVSRRNVITVTNRHDGCVRYGEDYLFSAKGKDCHYIAFDTDKEIDELISADIVYETISVRKETCSSRESLNEYEETRQHHDKTLVHDEVFVKTGLFSETGFDRIQTVDSFLAENQDVKEESGDAFKGLKWVLRFEETDYKEYTYVDLVPIKNTLVTLRIPKQVERYIHVEKISILRLSFLDDGIPYNMGVVDDVRSGDNIPDNNVDGPPEWFIILLIVLAVLALLAVLWVCSLTAPILKPVLSALVWVLLLPFKLLWWLIKAIWGWIQKE